MIFEQLLKRTNGKLVIVIDEFQLIIKNPTSLISDITTILKRAKQNEFEVMFLLCSSSISFVENSMVKKIGMAAYEITGFLKIKEQNFRDLVQHFPRFSMEQCVELYSILGGVHGLWDYMDDSLTIEENIIQHILKKGCFLREEGSRYVSSELREMSVYNTILSALANGKRKLNDLYACTGFSRAKISVYLKNLMELEIVEKVFSFDTEGRNHTQKGIYKISNHYVFFWYKYVYANLSKLEMMEEKEFYVKYIAPTFKEYVSEFFPDVCKEFLEEKNARKQLPIEFEKIGIWVGKVGTIDILAMDKNQNAVIAYCHWSKTRMRYDDVEWLTFCASKAKVKAEYVYLFSAGSFDEQISLEAKVKNNIKLIDISMLKS